MDRLLREGNPPTGQLASPVPQYKRLGSTDYEPVEGQHGAPFATLKDASGNVVSPATEDKLEQVRQLLAGVATEAKLEQARTLLDAISTKDFATQTTLAAVLAKLADLESELATIKANQLSGDQKVQLSGTIVELFRGTNIVLTAGSRIKLNPEPIDVSAFRGWQIGVQHFDQHVWEMRKIWYSGVFSHSATNSGFYEIDPIKFRDISPVYPCLGDKMTWWMSSDGTSDTPSFSVRIWGVK